MINSYIKELNGKPVWACIWLI